MKEVRCGKCNKLILKSKDMKGTFEIKCPRCGFVDNFFILDVEPIEK